MGFAHINSASMYLVATYLADIQVMVLTKILSWAVFNVLNENLLEFSQNDGTCFSGEFQD